MDAKQQTVATYNAHARAMGEKFNTIGARTADIDRTFSFVATQNPFVVEIGCGNGRDAKEICKRTKNYLGMDISAPMIELAREYTPEGKFVVADVEAYEFPQGIDIIFSFASLLHSDKGQLGKVLSRAYQALKPGSVFFVSLKHAPYEKRLIEDKFGARTFYFYTLQDIRTLAEPHYRLLWEEVETHLGVEWLHMLLQKT